MGDNSNQSAPRLSQISSLDGMRAVGALLVLGYHTGVAGFGWMGVHLFFVLSGFLITRILVTESRRQTLSFYLKRFYWRRSLRIFPLYYVFLTVALVIFVAKGQSLELFPWLYSYLYNWLKGTSMRFDDRLLGHLWSLAIEEQFYLIWPLIVYAAGRHIGKVAIALIVVAPLLRAASTDLYAYHATVCQMDALAFGAVVAIYGLEWLRSPRLWFYLMLGLMAIAGWLVEPAGFTAIPPTLGYAVLMPHGWQQVWGYTLLDGVFALAVLASVRGVPVTGLLENRALRNLGMVSYGFYLYHLPAREVVVQLLGPWLAQQRFAVQLSLPPVLVGLLTYAVAWLSYHFFEKKVLAYKDRAFSETRTAGAFRRPAPSS